MPTDYKGDKQKPSKMALIISVGPKMPKSPEDTSKPDDKAMKKAWDVLTKQMGAGMDGLDEDGNYPGPVSSDDLQDSVSQQTKDMTNEEINRKIMQMLPPIPPREERRNMMRDGTPHTPGQQSMIDRATEMYRQQKMRGE